MSKKTISAEFFSSNKSIWGVFYPTAHIVAVFNNSEQAESARQNVLSKLQNPASARVFSGETVAQDIKNGLQDESWLDELKKTIVAGLGNSMDLWEYDLKKAEQGASFLVIYCPDSDKVYDIGRSIKVKNPMSMRHYLPLVIEDLNDTLEHELVK